MLPVSFFNERVTAPGFYFRPSRFCLPARGELFRRRFFSTTSRHVDTRESFVPNRFFVFLFPISFAVHALLSPPYRRALYRIPTPRLPRSLHPAPINPPPPPPPLVPLPLKPFIARLCYSLPEPIPPCCLNRLSLYYAEVSRSGRCDLGTTFFALGMDVSAWPERFRTGLVKCFAGIRVGVFRSLNYRPWPPHFFRLVPREYFGY